MEGSKAVTRVHKENPARSRRVRAEQPPAEYWRRWQAVPAEIAPAAISEPATVHASMPMAVPVNVAEDLPKPSREPSTTPSPFRVLIVEPQRRQALFVKSVLHGAGIHAQIEASAANVQQAIINYRPDLILMELHMPDIDGIGLTALIRQHPEHQLLPIVFLTADADPELQFKVLDTGGDDILTKPVRPKYLIAAISNRIRRSRQQVTRDVTPDLPRPSDQSSALPSRASVLQQLAQALQQGAAGALYYIEIAAAPGLRERYGDSGFEYVMTSAGKYLAASVAYPLVRFNDNSFLMLAIGMDTAQLETHAQQIALQLTQHDMQIRGGDVLRLRCAIGFSALTAGFIDVDAALQVVERAALQARLHSSGVHGSGVAEDSVQDRLHLLSGQLEPAYQPILGVSGDGGVRYQVLLRLRQADGTLLPAGQVVPAAEMAGRIADLDQQVMEHALGLLHLYRYASPPLQLFVSQSARTLAAADYADWLLKSLARRKIDGAALVIDLRMADVLAHGDGLRQFCSKLVPARVSFSLSQFRPGPQSGAMLRQLPLKYVRLAGCYASSHHDPGLREELFAAIALVQRNHLQVIGQQVEDPQAAAVMWSGGVDLIQGNLVQAVGTDLNFDFHNPVL